MENVDVITRKKYKIEINDVDFNKQVKISSLFNYFQDVASKSVEHLGVGINKLKEEYGLAWVIIKMRVEVLRYPNWNEEIIVETWPKATKSLEFERDFLIYDNQGNIIAKATSIWVLLDIETRKVKRTNIIESNYQDLTKSALDYEFMKLMPFKNLDIVYDRMIGYSDIDFNGHLNNIKYIDFISDCLPFDKHKLFSIKALEINFINETLPGEVISLFNDLSKIDDHYLYVEGKNMVNQNTIFKALVEITPRE
ncbi:MAG TPA: acyl-ACP thioesterase domain-containing protein [Haloplasmataceae bacterium]